jgi:enoyl-CoA hydratase
VSAEILLTEHRADGVVVVTLNRPDKRNALNSELRQALIDTLHGLSSDDDVKALVLSGSGTTFCAGFDLDELMAADDPADLFTHATAYHSCVHTFDKPLLAAIEGAAVAGGMDLALMCDIRVAGSDAKFGQPQVKMGVPAAFDLLKTIVAEPVARELCMTGRVFGAEEALDMGLIQRSVEPGNALDVAVALAGEIAGVAGAIAMKRAFVSAQPELFADGEDGS